MNAKQELLDCIEGLPKIRCATISCGEYDYLKNEKGDYGKVFQKNTYLKINHTNDDLDKFLSNLDFSYDSGYGSQNLYGTVWLEDDTWLSRGEYDGSEWWEHNKLPEIPKECL
jgi:hypothetical protein